MSQRALGEQFDGYDNVPMEHYGVRVVAADHEKHLRKFHRVDDWAAETHEMPIERVRAGQRSVDANRVASLSDEAPARQPAVGLPGGDVMLKDGHHRLAKARQRGDRTFPVRVDSRYGECLDSHCGYN